MVNKVTHTQTRKPRQSKRHRERVRHTHKHTHTRIYRETRQQSCPTLAIVKNVKWMFYLTLTFMWFFYCGFIIIASCCCRRRKVFNRLTIKTADRNNWKQLRTYKQQKQRERVVEWVRERHGNSSTLIQREKRLPFLSTNSPPCRSPSSPPQLTHSPRSISASEREGETVSESSTFLAWPPTRRAKQSRATNTPKTVCAYCCLWKISN